MYLAMDNRLPTSRLRIDRGAVMCKTDRIHRSQLELGIQNFAAHIEAAIYRSWWIRRRGGPCRSAPPPPAAAVLEPGL